MSKLPDCLFKNTAWDHAKNPIWVGSALHLHRNMALYKFPGKMTSAEMASNLKALRETVSKLPSFNPENFIVAEELNPLEKELLFEHFHCTQSFQETGLGQGFAFNTNTACLMIFNEVDHLQIQQLHLENDLLQAWSALSQIEDAVRKNHPYAFSPRFGYLTSHPMNCGTALEARLSLHVPALRHTGGLGELLRKHSDENIEFLGLEGTMNDLVGDILIIKNRFTLGVAEETLLSLLQNTALKFVAAEKKIYEELKTQSSSESKAPELKDFVGRSFGLILHSYQLHSKEAWDGLSGLKLGAELGWIKGTTPQHLASLMLQQRRATLSHLSSLSPPDLSHLRAEWLHEQLKGITIVI